MNLFFDLKNYTLKTLRSDFIAALTVSIVLIPQSMAYAVLGGLPPVYGLYGSLVPLIVYGIFGSSKALSTGPVALISIILVGGLASIAPTGSQDYIDLVLFTGLIAGLLQLLYSVFKLGNFSDYLSAPLLGGFISAAGIIIIVSQIKSLFTIKVASSDNTLKVLIDTLSSLGDADLASAALGIIALIIIVLLKKINKEIPSALLVVFVSSLFMYFLQDTFDAVPIIGTLPSDLPMFYTGFLNIGNLLQVFPTAIIVSLVCFVTSISIAKSLSDNKEKFNSNTELFALGLSKVVGSFFLSMPSSSSFSRSAINYQAGSKTGVSSILIAVILTLTILYFGVFFYYLPIPVLAAIIIASVYGLIDFKMMKKLRVDDKIGLVVFLVTFLTTLLIGILGGIIGGVLASFLIKIIPAKKKQT